jgi:hypothetical protein
MKKGRGMMGYGSSLEHLMEELQRIDLLIRLQVARLRMMGHRAMDELRGLYITEDDIDNILGHEGPVDATEGEESSRLKPLRDRLAAQEARIAGRKASNLQAAPALRLERLRELFKLSPLDVDVLLICLAPGLDLRYEKLYAYLQDDVARKQPSVSLAIEILCPSLEAKLTARAHFSPTAPLLSHRLLSLLSDPPDRHAPLLAKSVQVDERIVEYLLGSDQCDARLLPFVRWENPARPGGI